MAKNKLEKMPGYDPDKPGRVPRRVKDHFEASTKQRAEYVPFDVSQSRLTGAAALKTKIVVGRIIKCRIMGMSYDSIGKNMGIHPLTAKRMVDAHIANTFPEDDTESLRTITNAQYDEIIKAYWHDGVEMADTQAAKVVLSAIAEKRKLHAVDKPQVSKTESTQNIQIDIIAQAAGILEKIGAGSVIDVEEITDEDYDVVGILESGAELEIDANLLAMLADDPVEAD